MCQTMTLNTRKHYSTIFTYWRSLVTFQKLLQYSTKTQDHDLSSIVPPSSKSEVCNFRFPSSLSQRCGHITSKSLPEMTFRHDESYPILFYHSNCSNFFCYLQRGSCQNNRFQRPMKPGEHWSNTIQTATNPSVDTWKTLVCLSVSCKLTVSPFLLTKFF